VILPWHTLKALKKAGWTQQKKGLHIAKVPHGRGSPEPKDFLACPSAHDLFRALILEGEALRVQQALAGLWIEIHSAEAGKDTAKP